MQANTRKLLFGIVLALTCAATCVAAPLPKDEKAFLAAMSLDEFKTVAYQDVAGARVDFDKFYDAVAAGKSFNMTKDLERSTATLTLTKKTTVKPDTSLVKRGDRLPEPSLRDLNGRAINLHARANRPLLMNFFFAACTPCIQETPTLNAFAKSHQDTDVIAVTFDDAADARKYVAKHGFAWPISAEAKAFIDKLGVKTYPTFAYVGKDGKLLGIAQSSQLPKQDDLTVADLETWIDKLAP